MKDYEYYKKKYKKLTLQLDREKDADIINFIEQFRSKAGVKRLLCAWIRELMRAWENE